jgi:hypothetical protein
MQIFLAEKLGIKLGFQTQAKVLEFKKKKKGAKAKIIRLTKLNKWAQTHTQNPSVTCSIPLV